MNKKDLLKKVLNYGLLLGSFVVVSIIIDLLVFNFKLLFLDADEKGVHVVSDYQSEIIGEDRVITIDFDDDYVSKLRIKYDTKQDVNITISYVEDDYYNQNKTGYISDILDNVYDEQIANYNNNIEELKIMFAADSDIEINEISVDNSIRINYYRVGYLVAFMLIIYIIYKYYKSGAKVEEIYKYFLLLGLIVGSTMIFLQPVGSYYSWDDQIHFKDTYELIGGDLEWQTGEFFIIDDENVGKRVVNSLEEQEQHREFLNSGGEVKYTTYGGRFITYKEISYIPSAIGFYICKFLNLPFVICYKMGKFMNLLTYLLVMAYAIKISKNFKRILTVIALIPTSIFLASQYAYDPAVTSGLTLGLVCLFNWLLDKDSKVDFKSMAIFVFANLYGCFPKAVYAPLLLIFLFIPKEKFRSEKEARKLKMGVIVLCLLVLATFVLPTVTGTMGSDTRGGATSVSAQLKVILKYPIGYLKVLKDTLITNFMGYFLGKDILGFYSYVGKISDNLYLVYLIFMLFILFTEEVKHSLKLKNKLIILLGTMGIVLLIWTSLYLAFTPVGVNTINGVQPRYFIPLLLPMFCILKTDKIKNNLSSKIYNTLVIAIPVIVIAISLYQMFIFNYCL